MKHRRLPIMGLLAFVLLVGCTSKSKDTMSKVAVEEQVEQNANEGWKMLFNGHNFEGWKSISSDQTPKYGWKIENKELIVEESNGGESLHGGDIITQKKYSDFELKWEWKMNTVGGNSGLKYYVNSSGKNNAKHGIPIIHGCWKEKWNLTITILQGPVMNYMLPALKRMYPHSESGIHLGLLA